MKGIENLEVGKVYTYKELCALFEEREVDGNSRPSQKRRWEQYFVWSNPTKQKYKIEDIHEEPLPRIDGRKNNGGNSTSKFILLDDILMGYLIEMDTVKCTIPQLSTLLNITTSEYAKYRNNPSFMSDETGIPLVIIEEFLRHLRNSINNAIVSSIERLEKEGRIQASSYMVLSLKDGSRIKLSAEKSREITEWENEVLGELGYNRQGLFNEVRYKVFQKEMNSKIKRFYSYDCNYYYKEYLMKCLVDEYEDKSAESSSRLTRKFFITIGINMLKTICQLKHINEMNQSELIEHTIVLANALLMDMNDVSWDKFWDEEELNWDKDEDKAMLFWSQFCLVKMNRDIQFKKTIESNEVVGRETYNKSFEECRQYFVDGLSEEDVIHFEKIIPNLDWQRILCSDEKDAEAYTLLCVSAIETYEEYMDRCKYCENEPIEEFCLYLAKKVMEKGTIDNAMPLYEFKEKLGDKEWDI